MGQDKSKVKEEKPVAAVETVAEPPKVVTKKPSKPLMPYKPLPKFKGCSHC